MLRKQQKPAGIILDEPFASGLLVKALEGGHATVRRDGPYTRSVLANGRHTGRGQKALEMLLLFDTAYLVNEFDDVNVDTLKRMGLWKTVPFTSEAKRFDINDAKGIKALLVADMRQRGVAITSKQFDELLPEVSDIREGEYVMFAEEATKAAHDLPEAFQQVVDEYWEELRTEFAREREVARRRTPAERQLANEIVKSDRRICNLMNASAATGLPVLSSIARTPKVKANWDSLALDRSVHFAVAIYLREQLNMPHVKTLEDVLRLREDQHVRLWRAKILQWTDALRSGAFSSEDEIRREIREANDAIRALDKWKTVNMWTTYAAVGLDILGLLLQMPLTLVVTTPLGLGIDTFVRLQEWRHSWVLFGRGAGF